MKPKKPDNNSNGGVPLVYFLYAQEARKEKVREQKEIKPKASKTNGVEHRPKK